MTDRTEKAVNVKQDDKVQVENTAEAVKTESQTLVTVTEEPVSKGCNLELDSSNNTEKVSDNIVAETINSEVQSTSSAVSNKTICSFSQESHRKGAVKRPQVSESSEVLSQFDIQKALKIKRYKLQIEHFKLVNYRTKLQIHKLERELGIQNSVYTSNLLSNEQ